MKRKNTSVLIAILFSIAILLFTAGCDQTQVEKTSKQVSATAAKLSGVAPPSISLILTAIATISAAVGATTTAIRECREKIKMKKAIIAKADQIDKIIIATQANSEKKESPVLDFMKADMRVATPSRKKDLNVFDTVRKNG